MDTKNPETLRIYSEVEKSCERLNAYAMDFFETVKILKENLASGRSSEGEIDFVLGKIDELNAAMNEISHSMPELVELVKFN